MKYQATEIKWETDGYDELPTELDIPDSIAIDEFGNIDYEGIDNYLSDQTGFLHNGYVLEEMEES